MLAAHQIVSQTVSMIFMIPLGISSATTVRIGQWLGQQNIPAVKRTGAISIGIAILSMTLISILLLLFPQSIIGLYIDPQSSVLLALLPKL